MRKLGERSHNKGDALAALGARIVLTGAQEEAHSIGQMQAKKETPAHNICGRLSLCGLTGVFSRCRLIISNDTGPLHLAYALGTPKATVLSQVKGLHFL
jgi:ADP-heptose:LPS heptosyltransferase